MRLAATLLLLLTAWPATPSRSSSGPPYDLTPFETTVLPAWLELYTIDHSLGLFSYEPNATTLPDLFGTVDVAHVLAAVGQLDSLTPAQKDAWKGTIDAHQTLPGGFYVCHKQGVDGASCLGSDRPDWTAGEATATLALLGKQPLHKNTN